MVVFPCRLKVLGLCLFSGLGVAVTSLLSQTVPVTADTSLFSGFVSSGQGIFDPEQDTQTGINSADLIGYAAGTTGLVSTVGGAAVSPTKNIFGAMLAADNSSTGGMTFRVRLLDQNGTKTYSGTVIQLGISLYGLTPAGALSIFATVNSTSGGNTLQFYYAGTGADNSPSTTSLATIAGITAVSLTSANFDYSGVAAHATGADALNYQLATDSKQFANMYETFSFSYASLQAAVRALGTQTTPSGTVNYSNVVIDNNTVMQFMVATAQQTNAINQDIYGTAVKATSTLSTTWSALGAFSDPASGSSGGFVKTPEPATAIQLGMLTLAGLAGLYFQRRRSCT